MRQIYRSRRNKKLTGLCGGLSEVLNVDANLIRILCIVVAVFTSGAIILIYILATLVVPKEPPYYNDYGYGGPGYGGPGCGGPGYGGPAGYDGGGYGMRQDRQHSRYGGPYANPSQGSAGWREAGKGQSADDLDSMMDDLEKKALRKEIEELRAKLAKYEKGDF